jgi:hypothetical protein
VAGCLGGLLETLRCHVRGVPVDHVKVLSGHSYEKRHNPCQVGFAAYVLRK